MIMVAMAVPAEAQFREAVPARNSSSQLYQASGAIGKVISKIFNPSVFSMSHGIEMSAGSFGGYGYSMGMYTNTMAWQFSDKLAMRADVAVAYSPQSKAMTAMGFDRSGPRVFLRNAEIAWKPSEKVRINIHVQQNPYAFRNPYMMNPYGGYYGFQPYGWGPTRGAGFGYDRWR